MRRHTEPEREVPVGGLRILVKAGFGGGAGISAEAAVVEREHVITRGAQ